MARLMLTEYGKYILVRIRIGLQPASVDLR
jgi:hypothetical protein